MKKSLQWIWWVLGVVGAVILFVLAKVFFGKNAPATILVPPSPKETAAVEKQVEALMERAKAEAVSDEQRKTLAEIQNISDPHERLKRLADELKDL